jgi:hypothetical protein
MPIKLQAVTSSRVANVAGFCPLTHALTWVDGGFREAGRRLLDWELLGLCWFVWVIGETGFIFGEAMALLGNDDMNFYSRLKWTLQIHGPRINLLLALPF